jgi:hypothetical protein
VDDIPLVQTTLASFLSFFGKQVENSSRCFSKEGFSYFQSGF